MKQKIELLNSEGPILTMKKRIQYELKFEQMKETMFVDEQLLVDFLMGRTELKTPDGRVWRYTDFSSGMKPKQSDLEDFIGKKLNIIL